MSPVQAYHPVATVSSSYRSMEEIWEETKDEHSFVAFVFEDSSSRLGAKVRAILIHYFLFVLVYLIIPNILWYQQVDSL